jgi:hypothetical protein
MAGHVKANKESQIICDRLFQCLSQKILNLYKSETQSWCGIYQEGRKRFAYIDHRKTLSYIEVWCLGDPADLQSKTVLGIEPRKPTSGGFGFNFQSRFRINNLDEVAEACELLYSISYKLS